MEDVLPEWMRAFAGSTSDALFTGTWAGKPYRGPRPGRIKTKVCRACNQWMNQAFEEITRPLLINMLEFRVDYLASEDQHRLARWAAKTMTLRAVAARVPELFMPAEEIRRLRATGEPSDSCRIVIGTYGESGTIPRSRRDLPATRVQWDRRTRLSEPAYHSTLVFGPVVVVYLYQHQRVRYRSIAEAAGLVRPIWPLFGQPVDWPVTPLITARTSPSLDLAIVER
jgi:hypothetical protein